MHGYIKMENFRNDYITGIYNRLCLSHFQKNSTKLEGVLPSSQNSI